MTGIEANEACAEMTRPMRCERRDVAGPAWLARRSGLRANPGEAGYTLVELLVVLVILSVLTATGYFMVSRYPEIARERTAKAEISEFSSALEGFRLDIGRYPTTEEGLAALMKAPATSENWNGPYFKKANLDDPWGHPYVYRSPGQHGDFDLYSYGVKGKEGGSDTDPPIKSW
jgi:general secretion pathway protein G